MNASRTQPGAVIASTADRPKSAPRTRRKRWTLIVVVTLLALGVTGGVYVKYGRTPGQAMSIPGGNAASAAALWPSPAPPTVKPSGPAFVSGVSSDGRYLVDQYGKPLLIQGDSPWAMMTRLEPAQAEAWFDNRKAHGFNAAIVSLVGATRNGAPDDQGTTVDGLRPFVDGDMVKWQPAYWSRVLSYVRMAQQRGITMMLYPIDGWTIGHAIKPTSISQCQQYGALLARQFSGLPNIVWMAGGDYFPGEATHDLAIGSDVDHCMDATMRALREAGDPHLFSIQLGYDKSISTDNPYWARRVDWNFVYTYYPTYRAVLEAYARRPAIPAVLGESNYEGENNQASTPTTTDETLRRQVLWSLTSGASGEFMGTKDWQFLPGWQERLNTPAVGQIQRLRALFAGLDWWRLVPDTGNRLVTAGRGDQITTDDPLDVLQNDYVTASRTPDGRLAVVYLPVRRTITLDLTALAPGVTASWVDPASGVATKVPLSGQFSSPGVNSEGQRDWLLVLRAP